MNILPSWALLAWLAIPGADGGAVWIEGEAPGSINFTPVVSGWGRKEFLSGEKWLHVAVDADKVARDVPSGGITIRYHFRVGAARDYEVWDRVGFEFVRSPIAWRVDGGAWSTVGPEVLTTDLMELDFFCEVAWLKLGSRTLAAGEHALEIRLDRSKGGNGKDERILYSSDALCIHPGPFHPDGKARPGEDGRDARDREAGRTVFRSPAIPADGRRTSLPLDGLWEICRDDEQAPGEVAEPIRSLPADPRWKGIAVPGDKNVLRPDLLFAHRLWYRTRVEVPEGAAGRSWSLAFPQNSLNTTVFVNGTYCGFDKNPFAHVEIDISKAVRPGVNEVWVGIRDAWYARTANPDDPMKLRRTFNLPRKFFQAGFQDLDYPVWGSPHSGILSTPTLVSAGPVTTSDVFVRPSVATRQLAVAITLRNTSDRAIAGEVRLEAVDDSTGDVARAFKPTRFRLGARAVEMVETSDPWADPKLWWPDDPHLYRLRTTLEVDGRPVDVRETPFGFREWRVEGTKFTLNGVVWHLWGDTLGATSTREEWLARYRRTGQRLMRLATAGQGGETSGWMGLSPDEALDFFDRSGVVVRRNSTLDGEAIGYNFVEKDPAIVRKQGGSELKLGLIRNVRDQFVAQVKGERNHPSIQIWSMENEFAYINLINLLGNGPLMDAYEREEQAIADAVMAADPTRTVMADGGGAFQANTMPVHGDHYVATLDQRYPDLAYGPFPEGGGRGRWRWDGKRPRYIGEDFFASGINPADYAMWGGEVTFGGKAESREAVARVYRMLTEGYRWGGHHAAWHLWVGDEAPGQHASNPWRAAFCRQYDWSFGSGAKVVRTFGLFNDTHSADPLTFTRTLTVGGKPAWSRTTAHAVAPGTSVKFDDELTLPPVAAREEGELVLALSAGGREVFRDVKPVSILPEARPGPATLGPGGLAVLDPRGDVAAYLRANGLPFSAVNPGEAPPESARVLIVGRDAIGAGDATSSRLAAYASAGRAVIVLEQDHPLKYGATPAGLEPASSTVRDGSGIEATVAEGRTAFIEDPGHPAFRGLRPKDFFTWGPDHVVYRKPYVKPARDGRSLVQVGPRLVNSALVEVPVGRGVLILGQLAVGEKLASNPVARRLLANLIDYGSGYRREFRGVAAVVDDPRLGRALDAIGLRSARATDPIEAIGRPDVQLAVISASPAHLRAMAAAPDRVDAFTRRGGYIVFHGLTPEGLADYNKVVGFDHLIRPFRRERVAFPAVRNPLTAGLTVGDVVLLSGERIFPWTNDEYVASDMFAFVVDHDDVAPFASSPFFAYGLITNGFVGADGWPLIIDFPVPPGGKPAEIVVDLPRPETIVEYTHIPSTNYWTTTRVDLTFNGTDRLELPIKPTGDPQTFAIDPPRSAKQVKIQVAGWDPVAGRAANVGIDDIRLNARRSPGFLASVRPMLNVGGLVQYARGDGGIILCNLLLKDDEALPANAVKKRTILRTVLGNLRAPFAGGKTVIVGAGLAFEPVALGRHANQFRDEKGWFGDRNFTFAALPTGRQDFAGVTYDIFDFATSPVPTAIMLGGPGIPNTPPAEVRGIPVNRKADALFFLQAARIDQRRNDQEAREKKEYEIARYVVHYADGKDEPIPIRAEVDVDDYHQKAPGGLPGAQLAWTRPYPGTGESAVAYSKQWDNPRPDVEIRSVDVIPGGARARGTLALIAISAAVARPEPGR